MSIAIGSKSHIIRSKRNYELDIVLAFEDTTHQDDRSYFTPPIVKMHSKSTLALVDATLSKR